MGMEKSAINLSTNDAVIKLIILKLARSGNVKLVDCITHITNQILELDSQTGIAPSLSPKRLGLEERIKNCCNQLLAANLLVAISEHEFSLTSLGDKMLLKNMHELDEKSPANLPGYNHNLREISDRRTVSATCQSHYDEGFIAYRDGQNYTDNPYPNDRAEHLAWHNGWAEALDHENEHGPLFNMSH